MKLIYNNFNICNKIVFIAGGIFKRVYSMDYVSHKHTYPLNPLLLETPPLYCDYSPRVERGRYSHPRVFMSARHYKMHRGFRQLWLWRDDESRRNFLKIRNIEWFTVKSLEVRWNSLLLRPRYVAAYELTDHDVARSKRKGFYFEAYYMLCMWINMLRVRFRLNTRNYSKPVFIMTAYRMGFSDFFKFNVDWVKSIVGPGGAKSYNFLREKEYWRVQDEYHAWITAFLGRFFTETDSGTLLDDSVARASHLLLEDYLVGHGFYYDSGYGLGFGRDLVISNFFLDSYHMLREYVNKWWFMYRNYNYRVHWRILRRIERAFFLDMHYIKVYADSGLSKQLRFIERYFERRRYAIATGNYGGSYWFFMYRFWSVWFERGLIFVLPRRFFGYLISERPEFLVYNRKFLLANHQALFDVKLLYRKRAYTMDIKVYLDACQSLELEMSESMSISQEEVFLGVLSLYFTFDYSGIYGPDTWYEDLFWKRARFERDMLYSGIFCLMILHENPNVVFQKRRVYSSLEELRDKVLFNEGYFKLKNLGFMHILSLMSFFFECLIGLIRLRSYNFTYYYDARDIFVDDFIMFIRMVFWTRWWDIFYIRYLKNEDRWNSCVENWVPFYWEVYYPIRWGDDRAFIVLCVLLFILNNELLELHHTLYTYFADIYYKGYTETVVSCYALLEITTAFNICYEQESYDWDHDAFDEDEEADEYTIPLLDEGDYDWIFGFTIREDSETEDDEVFFFDIVDEYHDPIFRDDYVYNNPSRLIQKGWKRFVEKWK